MSEQVTARPYHKNPRKISAQQVVQLREWLAELGDLGGIVHDLNSGEIISGNQRSFHAFDLAQCEIEITHWLEEPDAQGTVAHGFVIWQGGRYAYRQVRWTAEQCEKANIIANKAGGTWDIESLLSGFEREGLLAWGFGDEELDDLANALAEEYLAAGAMDQESADAEPQTDRAEELRNAWGVETGQLWRLPSRTPGQEHRLICGDCTDAAVVERVMGGERAMAVVTDPPYAVFGSSTGIGKNITDDKMILPFCREVYRIACENTPNNAHVYIHCDWKSFNAWWSQLDRFDLRPLNCIVWDKGDGGIGTNYTNRHEFVLFLNREQKQATMTGGGGGMRLVYGIANVQRFNITQGDDRQHNAAKPVELEQVFVSSSTDEGEVVLEPFSGSGTTIIAAENLSRQCRAVEISPAYVAVALQRYQDAFGITPELLEDS